MQDKILLSDLRLGDVLMFRSAAFFGRAIRLVDGGETNHAALYLGGDFVSEAVSDGVVKNLLSKKLADNDLQRVVVKRLAHSFDNVGPVLRVSDYYLNQGARYAYEQIVLLAILCLTRRMVPTKSFGKLVRVILDHAATVLMEKYIASSKDSMICSELVYRCFDEAKEGVNDPYNLEIVGLISNWPSLKSFEDGLLDPRGDTLLAWAANQELARTPYVSKGVMGMTPAPIVAYKLADEKDSLDELIEQYHAELVGGSFVDMAELKSPDMLSSINYFAARYAAITEETMQEKKMLQGVEVKNIPDVLKMLFRTSADFVTPRDLEQCPDLKAIGDLAF